MTRNRGMTGSASNSAKSGKSKIPALILSAIGESQTDLSMLIGVRYDYHTFIHLTGTFL